MTRSIEWVSLISLCLAKMGFLLPCVCGDSSCVSLTRTAANDFICALTPTAGFHTALQAKFLSGSFLKWRAADITLAEELSFSMFSLWWVVFQPVKHILTSKITRPL